MSSVGVTPLTVKPSVDLGSTSVTIHIQEPSPTSEAPDHAEPAFPPGLSTDQSARNDAYWRHLREMWDASSDGPNSSRPSATSPASPAFSDDASIVDLQDVDLRSATVQKAFRLNTLPTLIKAQTEVANKPPSLDEPSTHTLPIPRSFSGRRTFNGVIITTKTTTRQGSHDPAPPYTPRASVTERSLGVGGYVVEQKEVSQINKWAYWIPSRKWLFWVGFIFPLLWALGAVTLFLGVYQSSAGSLESGTSKLSTFITQDQITQRDRLQNEKRWAKRCAWAFTLTLCLIPVITSIALIAPHLNTPEAAQVGA